MSAQLFSITSDEIVLSDKANVFSIQKADLSEVAPELIINSLRKIDWETPNNTQKVMVLGFMLNKRVTDIALPKTPPAPDTTGPVTMDSLKQRIAFAKEKHPTAADIKFDLQVIDQNIKHMVQMLQNGVFVEDAYKTHLGIIAGQTKKLIPGLYNK